MPRHLPEEMWSPLPEPRYLERPAFVALVGCLVGIGAFSTRSVLFWAGLLLLTGLAALVTAGVAQDKGLTKVTLYARLLGSVALIGAAFGVYAAERTHAALCFPDRLEEYDVPIEILYPAASTASSPVQYAARATIDGQEYRLLLRPASGERLPLEYGVCLPADLRLRSIATGESYHRYLLSEGFHASGSFTPLSSPVEMNHPPLASRLQAFREKLVRSFEVRTAGLMRPESAGLLAALSLGDRSRISITDRDAFRDSGLAHVMAVSGYHLGIVFLLLGGVLRVFLYQYRMRWLRYLLLFLGILGYTLLSGASTATVRALVMSTLLLLGRALGRQTDTAQLLSLTMLLFLLYQPFSYMSVGLLLSLAAVWGILSILPLFQRLIRPSLRWLSTMRDAFFVTIAAQLALLPLLFLFFEKIQLSIIWSNIPLVFLSGILIPLGLFLLLLTPLLGGAIPDLLYTVAGKMTEVMQLLTGGFGSREYALDVFSRWDYVALILYYATLFTAYWVGVRTLNARMSYSTDVV